MTLAGLVGYEGCMFVRNNPCMFIAGATCHSYSTRGVQRLTVRLLSDRAVCPGSGSGVGNSRRAACYTSHSSRRGTCAFSGNSCLTEPPQATRPSVTNRPSRTSPIYHNDAVVSSRLYLQSTHGRINLVGRRLPALLHPSHLLCHCKLRRYSEDVTVTEVEVLLRGRHLRPSCSHRQRHHKIQRPFVPRSLLCFGFVNKDKLDLNLDIYRINMSHSWATAKDPEVPYLAVGALRGTSTSRRSLICGDSGDSQLDLPTGTFSQSCIVYMTN
ncbi:hypothetical protein J6590_018203 [Homalodisca vitripennis]|nr:hypothetical protein J6590_018203 [Homalodisca vitripennis]